ncbi:cation:proton antiporter [Aquimarina brevivitae]|uniref:Sodium/proton antiporter (CPA1 family) n=1 Tax=Aquimarina brevivitae TaxID=323412 RepID=A0A4Q7P1V7_9FLAO|nr:cation:proton antiporter [Aquimarina brevivitae]RZS93846.1 sodium/proton antiporter (CPA1 family) [Aquimarina brevivitae]
MDLFSSYNVIIEVSLIIILSFIFNGISKKTNIPAVLMLIILGVIIQYVIKAVGSAADPIDFFPALEVLGIVGLIMIVLEAALELKLKRDKLIPILKAFTVALIGLIASTFIAAVILKALIEGMTMQSAWLYATPLSILSSAIIIPSVSGLAEAKKEFHIYESTFSDILGIMMFYFLTGRLNPAEDGGVVGFAFNIVLTIVISLIASYGIILIFQRIKSQVKLFLLIAVLLLLYALGKKMHLSSLIIILIFGLVIANMKLFFRGPLHKFLHFEKAKSIYHELHVITAETAFVVRTLFFVIFGVTIALSSLLNLKVTLISLLIIISIYLIRYGILRVFFGKDISPQVFIAPRGLITVLLFYAIPEEALIPGFEAGILLFVIIATSIIMTLGMIRDKKQQAMQVATSDNLASHLVDTTTDIDDISDENNAPNTQEDLLGDDPHEH